MRKYVLLVLWFVLSCGSGDQLALVTTAQAEESMTKIFLTIPKTMTVDKIVDYLKKGKERTIEFKASKNVVSFDVERGKSYNLHLILMSGKVIKVSIDRPDVATVNGQLRESQVSVSLTRR